jgi:hypothetical protein
MSPTLVVAAARPSASTPQGARHRCLQLPDLQLQHLPEARRQRFLALMVGLSGPPVPAPPEDLSSMFLSIDGVRSQTSISGTSRGPPSMG